MKTMKNLLEDVERLEFKNDGDWPLRNSIAWQALCAEAASLEQDANKWRGLGKLPDGGMSRDASQDMLALCNDLITVAEHLGLVVRIETRALEPLAMGNYEMVASVQERREPAVPYDQLNNPLLPIAQAAVSDIMQQAIEQVDGCMDVTQVEPEDAAAWEIVKKRLTSLEGHRLATEFAAATTGPTL